MDVFFEQLVTIKKNGKAIAVFITAWLGALLLCGLAFLLSFMGLGSIFILLIAGIIFATIKFTGLLNIEYEYILTNGVMDIDRITNKSTRKRLLSFDVANVTRLEKYNASLLNNIDRKRLVFACGPNPEDAYFMVCEKEGKKAEYLVFTPNEKMKGAIVKFLPKYVANSAFK